MNHQDTIYGTSPLPDIDQVAQVITLLAACADRQDLDGFMGLLANESTIIFGDQSFKGRAQIRKLMTERFAAGHTYHHGSPLWFERQERLAVTCNSSAIIFERLDTSKQPNSYTPRRIVNYRDELVRLEKSWKIKCRSISTAQVVVT